MRRREEGEAREKMWVRHRWQSIVAGFDASGYFLSYRFNVRYGPAGRLGGPFSSSGIDRPGVLGVGLVGERKFGMDFLKLLRFGCRMPSMKIRGHVDQNLDGTYIAVVFDLFIYKTTS